MDGWMDGGREGGRGGGMEGWGEVDREETGMERGRRYSTVDSRLM